jgi:hypothetical protein
MRPPARPVERCELCGVAIPSEHDHVLELNNRKLQCACTECALLFHDGVNLRFIRVPHRCNTLQDFRLDDKVWEGFLIPINLAFFYYHSGHKRVVAVYPSPAGATESLLELETWNELAEANPVLNQFVPDIEALLVNRVGESREYYRVSIDRCYELVGLIRRHWRGLSGGTEVWTAITEFFCKLQSA